MSKKNRISKGSPRRKKIRRAIFHGLLLLLILLLIPVWNIYRTLSSLKKIDDYPVYTMDYSGGYNTLFFFGEEIQDLITSNSKRSERQNERDGGCTIFSALAEKDPPLVGRHFDWSYSPMLVLHTHPRGSYESLALVDLAYLGFDKTTAPLESLPTGMALRCIASPLLVLEGINEHGLTIAIAAVPKKSIPLSRDKKTLHSCSIIRKILDHAKDTSQAIQIISSYNPVFIPGPTVHYLIADPGGNSAVVEFTEKGIQILRNPHPWQAATNFYLADIASPAKPLCSRFQRISRILEQHNGALSSSQAMDALQKVSLKNTQWSVVYSLKDPQIQLVLSRNYNKILTFPLRQAK